MEKSRQMKRLSEETSGVNWPVCRLVLYGKATHAAVELKEYFSGQTLHAVAEAPKEALPRDCRPSFDTAWMTKMKFKQEVHSHPTVLHWTGLKGDDFPLAGRLKISSVLVDGGAWTKGCQWRLQGKSTWGHPYCQNKGVEVDDKLGVGGNRGRPTKSCVLASSGRRRRGVSLSVRRTWEWSKRRGITVHSHPIVLHWTGLKGDDFPLAGRLEISSVLVDGGAWTKGCQWRLQGKSTWGHPYCRNKGVEVNDKLGVGGNRGRPTKSCVLASSGRRRRGVSLSVRRTWVVQPCQPREQCHPSRPRDAAPDGVAVADPRCCRVGLGEMRDCGPAVGIRPAAEK
ncbi:hypothetical protein KSP40_PGU018372 [Platanthera guangdongensis]|uniref:Uncharacterized protein n=1 Tax=Platanthera guangdongensis TaxID=2320717 RepID=A0ABR2MJ30_9ASPA